MNDINAEERIQDDINNEDISKHTPLNQMEKTNILGDIGNKIEQESQEEKENIEEHQANKEQTEKPKTKEWETKEGETEAVKSDEMKSEETKEGETEAVKSDEMKSKETKEEETEAIKSDEMKSEEVTFEKVTIEKVKSDEMKSEEMKSEEVTNEKVKSEEVKNEEVKNEDVNIPGETEIEDKHGDNENFDESKMFISEESEMHKDEQELITEKNLPSKCDSIGEIKLITPDGIKETHKTLMVCENDVNVTAGNMKKQLIIERRNVLETPTSNRNQKELTIPFEQNSESDVFVSYPSDSEHLRSNEEIQFFSTEVFELSDEEILKKNNVENRNETLVESARNCASVNLSEDADALKKELQTETENRDNNDGEYTDEKEYDMSSNNACEKSREEAGNNTDFINTAIDEPHTEDCSEAKTVWSDNENVKDPKDLKNEDKREETEKEENIVTTNAQTKRTKTASDAKKDDIKTTAIKEMYTGRDINKIEILKVKSSSYVSSRKSSNNSEQKKNKKSPENKLTFPKTKVLTNRDDCMKQIGGINKEEQNKKDVKKKISQKTSKKKTPPRSPKDEVEDKCKDTINKKEKKTGKKGKNDTKEDGDKHNFDRDDSRYDFRTIQIKPLNLYHHSSSFDKNGKEADKKNIEKNESNNISINGSNNESVIGSNKESSITLNKGSNNKSNNGSTIQSNNEFNKNKDKYTFRSFASAEKESGEASSVSSVEISPRCFEASDDKESTHERRIGNIMSLLQNVKKQNIMNKKNVNNKNWSAYPEIKKANNKFGVNKMPLTKNVGSLHNIAQKTHLNIFDRTSFKKSEHTPMESFLNRVPKGHYANDKYEYDRYKNYNSCGATRLPAPIKTRTVGTQTDFTKKVSRGTSTPHFVNVESDNKIALPNFIYIPTVKLPLYNFDAIQVQNGRIVPQKIGHEKTVFQSK